MLDILPPLPALLATMAAGFCAGLARGFSGFGSALIFIPVAAAAVGPRLAAALLLLTDNLAALPMIRPAWRVANRREVAVMVAGTLAGLPLGVLVLDAVDPRSLRWAIVGLAVALLALLVSGWRYHGRPAPAATLGVGALSGFMSGSTQLGGPPVIAYWMGRDAPAPRLRADIVIFFAGSAVVSTAIYALHGLLTLQAFATAACVLPGYAAGVLLGMRLFGKASERLFRRICYALIALAALLGMPVWDR
jgi:uncharacterized membrane protein YfcA